MSVVKRVRCPNIVERDGKEVRCATRHDLRNGDANKKSIVCRRCGHHIAIGPDTADWFIEYYAKGVRYWEKVGFSKTLAEKALGKRKAEVAENRFIRIKKETPSVPFKDFSADYFERHSKQNNKSWYRTDRPNIKILNAFFGEKLLSDITSDVVETFKEKRFKEVKPATVQRNLSCLSSIFNKAKQWKRFEGENPVSQLPTIKVESIRLRFLDGNEIYRLLESCDGYLKIIVIVALNTGMRRGEILSLKWQDIHFESGTIHVSNTKSHRSRQVPMNDKVRAALSSAPRHATSNFVFFKKDGSAIGDIKKSYATALKKAGIQDACFHTLRHSAASHIVMATSDLYAAKEILGHSTIEMTMRYAHLSPNHKQQAVEALSRRIDAVATPSNTLVNSSLAPVPVNA